MTENPCTCPGAKAALHYALTDTTPPECPQHDTGAASGPAIALNDNHALAAAIGANLNTPEN